jgi:hypothetical protein
VNGRLAYPPILFNDEDAAYYLGISVTTLNRLQAAKHIIPKDLGGRRGFLRDDLEEFARNLPDWVHGESRSRAS